MFKQHKKIMRTRFQMRFYFIFEYKSTKTMCQEVPYFEAIDSTVADKFVSLKTLFQHNTK